MEVYDVLVYNECYFFFLMLGSNLLLNSSYKIWLFSDRNVRGRERGGAGFGWNI